MGFPRFLSLMFLVRNNRAVLPSTSTTTTCSSVPVVRSRAARCWSSYSSSSDNDDNNKETHTCNKHSRSSRTHYELSPVQSTSLLVAYWRDVETRQQQQQQQPLIVDPTAQLLVDALLSPSQRQSYDSSPIRPYGIECLAVRTRAMDDWLTTMNDPNHHQRDNNHHGGKNDKRIPSRKKRHLVNLGAGMCGRPYRMGNNLSHYLHSWWEVDSDLELLQVKRSVLEAAGLYCDNPEVPIVDVSIDLSCPHTSLADTLQSQPGWWLGSSSSSSTDVAAGGGTEDPKNDKTRTTTIDWVAEGLFAYLEPDQHTKVLQETASISARGSRMAVTVAEPAMSEFWESLGVTLPYRVLVPIDDILGKAQDFGWVVDRHIQPHDWSKLYPGRGEELPGYHVVFFEKD